MEQPQRVHFEKLIERRIERTFERKKEKLGIEAELDLQILDHPPVVDENVYGEAFPEERRVMIDVFPEATTGEIEAVVCEELAHVKHPELRHGSKFWEIVEECKRNG